MELKRVFLGLLEFDVLEEEADVDLGVVLVLVIEAVLDDLALDLSSGHPGQKVLIELSSLEDGVLEVQLHLFDRLLGVGLQIAHSRVHYYFIIAYSFSIITSKSQQSSPPH